MIPPRVLVVDDEAIMVTLLETYLKRLGCAVSTAADGAKAIRLLEERAFDLVITDLQMEETNGLDVVRKAKELSPKTLAFIMTGCNEVEYAIAAFRIGADDYLLKPLNLGLLMERLLKRGFSFNRTGQLHSQAGGRNTFSRCQKSLQSGKALLYSCT
jgi:DNA-binding response OmpR family regulator